MLKKLTKIQIVTLIAFIAYAIWEVFVCKWAESLPSGDPIIRADLVIIYPILAILSIISIYQFLKKNK